MFLFKNLNKSIVVYAALVLFFVASLFATYYWGGSGSRAKIIEQEAIEFQETTDRVNQGLNEVRKANPSRDAGIALERLRERQSER